MNMTMSNKTLGKKIESAKRETEIAFDECIEEIEKLELEIDNLKERIDELEKENEELKSEIKDINRE
jgi:predicted RNase H-like nuclease (RuvC/YqgF family)